LGYKPDCHGISGSLFCLLALFLPFFSIAAEPATSLPFRDSPTSIPWTTVKELGWCDVEAKRAWAQRFHDKILAHRVQEFSSLVTPRVGYALHYSYLFHQLFFLMITPPSGRGYSPLWLPFSGPFLCHVFQCTGPSLSIFFMAADEEQTRMK